MSHRALMLGALAVGRSHVSGLLEGDDVLATARALQDMGVPMQRTGEGRWVVHGLGVGGLRAPDGVLDLGNSGTGVRLLMGIAATLPFATVFTGDASLRARPMSRVSDPLCEMGAQIIARDGDKLPLTITGTADPLPITYRQKVASAQVKSAILLAGLNAPGVTSVIEPTPSRDHTENMMRHFGAEISVSDEASDGVRTVRLRGYPELSAADLCVPGDISSAAFPMVAALITPDSELILQGVGVNPLRAGLIETLVEMGGDIALSNRREEAGEPVADITVRSSALKGIDVSAERAPSMIDEYPALAVAAATADGVTTMRGLAELRVKESDRVSAIAKGLAINGVVVEEAADSLVVHGAPKIPGGGLVETHMDHRIAMAFLVLGLAAQAPIVIDDDAMIATSFPGFTEMMGRLGISVQRSDT